MIERVWKDQMFEVKPMALAPDEQNLPSNHYEWTKNNEAMTK